MLGPPDAFEARAGVGVEQLSVPGVVPGAQRLGEHGDVGDGQVQALGAGRRHDVRGVAGEEQPLVPHRLGDEAAHRGDRLLQDRPVPQLPAVGGREPRAQLGPDPLVGPCLDVVAGSTWR